MNDILLDDPLSKVKENMAGTFDKAEKAGLDPIFIGLPPLTRIESTEKGWQLPSEFEKHNEVLKEYRQWLKEEANRRKLPILDYEQVLSEGEKAVGHSLFEDGLHPTPEGYRFIAEAFVDLLDKTRKEKA